MLTVKRIKCWQVEVKSMQIHASPINQFKTGVNIWRDLQELPIMYIHYKCIYACIYHTHTYIYIIIYIYRYSSMHFFTYLHLPINIYIYIYIIHISIYTYIYIYQYMSYTTLDTLAFSCHENLRWPQSYQSFPYKNPQSYGSSWLVRPFRIRYARTATAVAWASLWKPRSFLTEESLGKRCLTQDKLLNIYVYIVCVCV